MSSKKRKRNLVISRRGALSYGAGALAAAGLAGCSSSNSSNSSGDSAGTLSADDFSAHEQVDEGLANVVGPYLDSSGLVDAAEAGALLDDVAEYASSQEGVASVSRDDGCVLVTYEGGLMWAYVPPVEDADAGGNDVSVMTLEPFYTPVDGWDNQTYQGAAAGDSQFDSAARQVAELPSCTFGGNFDDGAVNLTFLKSLSPDSLVVYHGHGNYISDIGPFLTTGEVFDRSSYQRYEDDFNSGLLLGCGGGSSEGRICVTSAFFDDAYRAGDLDSCVFFLGACHGLHDTRLASVLHDKGANLVMGFSQSVSTRYDCEMCQAVLGYEDYAGVADTGSDGQFLTWGEAIRNAKATLGEEDPYYKSDWGDGPARLVSYPSGAADGLRLAEAEHGADDSEEALRAVLNAASGDGTVVGFFYGDYDSDGVHEAFAVAPRNDEDWENLYADLWFVTPDGAEIVEAEAYVPDEHVYLDASTGDYVITSDSVASGSPYSFYMHRTAVSRGSWPGDAHVYGVKDGTCKLMAISSQLTGFTSGDGGTRFVGYAYTDESEETYQLELNEDTFEFDIVG